MQIMEFFALSPARQRYWTEQIASGDWRAAPYLARLLRSNTFQEQYGPNGRVFLLTDGDDLVSFCTLVPRDEIPDDRLFPWIGFVYTFPAFRGRRCSEVLIRHVCAVAREEGVSRIYVSSDEEGLYEKYGFQFTGLRNTREGKPTQVFYRDL